MRIISFIKELITLSDVISESLAWNELKARSNKGQKKYTENDVKLMYDKGSEDTLNTVHRKLKKYLSKEDLKKLKKSIS